MITQILSPKELKELISDGAALQIVDVRSEQEYRTGHVPGAINISMDELASRVGDLNSRLRVVMVCNGGHRARLACEQLGQTNHDIWRLEGGTDAWIQSGLPVVTTAQSGWSIERQVRLTVGVISVLTSILALAVSSYWAIPTLVVGAGLTFAGLTNRCGLATVLVAMPWNRRTI